MYPNNVERGYGHPGHRLRCLIALFTGDTKEDIFFFLMRQLGFVDDFIWLKGPYGLS